ncbi:MAG TPA: radical SAM protein [Xanthobacteraceae bacterium]
MAIVGPIDLSAVLNAPRRRRFCLMLIKPSHYDDDGYVLQWLRSPIPSNSLAALYGLAKDCAERAVLGFDTDFDIQAYDETNTRIRTDRIAQAIKGADGGMVMLVGVQSNQFPRALDIAAPLRSLGIPVAIGGFHVSGVIGMLGGADPDLERAKAMGVALFAGEAEGRLDQVLRDAVAGALKPLYNYMNNLPAIQGAPIPLLPSDRVHRTAGSATTFDAGRGCPYQCSFCTIINVQGRTSRRRSADDIDKIVRTNYAQGVRSFFITDDNFARNKDWELILDRLILLREVEKLRIGFIIQVDTLCYKLPNFIEKCGRAGVRRVFIGLENINPDNLLGAKKRQNRITEYRTMLLAWKAARVITYAGYIIGFPNDTVESILRDVEIIKRELPIDLIEFFMLTPLPGSEDHQKLFRAGVALDPDMNNYDLTHACTAHSRISCEEWRRAYKLAWQNYYTLDHIETMLRRVASTGANAGNALFLATWFKGSVDFENVHPLESGFLRRKIRRDRRSDRAIEPRWRFYPRYYLETIVKLWSWGALYLRLRRTYLRIKHDPRRREYMDLAMSPVADEEFKREIFQTEAARGYLNTQQRLDNARHRAAAGTK